MTIPSWVKVRQKVKYEIAAKPIYFNLRPYTPRWDSTSDGGPTGRWAKGEIIEVIHNKFFIRCLESNVEGTNRWMIPLPGHSRYEEDQWNRPGQIQPVDVPVEKKDSTKPPFMDASILDGIEYEVYRHTLKDKRYTAQGMALQEFQKILSRRLREWPTCCGDYVELGYSIVHKGENAIFIPKMTCLFCGKMVHSGG